MAGAAVHVGDDVCFTSLLGFAAGCAAVHIEMMVLFFCFRAYRLAGLLRGELNGAAVHIEDDGFWFLLGRAWELAWRRLEQCSCAYWDVEVSILALELASLFGPSLPSDDTVLRTGMDMTVRTRRVAFIALGLLRSIPLLALEPS